MDNSQTFLYFLVSVVSALIGAIGPGLLQSIGRKVKSDIQVILSLNSLESFYADSVLSIHLEDMSVGKVFVTPFSIKNVSGKTIEHKHFDMVSFAKLSEHDKIKFVYSEQPDQGCAVKVVNFGNNRTKFEIDHMLDNSIITGHVYSTFLPMLEISSPSGFNIRYFRASLEEQYSRLLILVTIFGILFLVLAGRLVWTTL